MKGEQMISFSDSLQVSKYLKKQIKIGSFLSWLLHNTGLSLIAFACLKTKLWQTLRKPGEVLLKNHSKNTRNSGSLEEKYGEIMDVLIFSFTKIIIQK